MYQIRIRRVFFLTLLAGSFSAHADEDLQKKLSNPVADIVTLPFQWTTNNNVGLLREPQQTLNIEPVYPIKLGSDWSLINRAIIPLLSNPASVQGENREEGLGDITYEAFFSPTRKEGGMIWGFGPILTMRTATEDSLGQGKWSAGPAVLVLKESPKWTVGGLFTQVWSFAGDENREDVSAFSLQPIVSYRINPKYSIGYLGTITADWKENRSSERWTVPVGVSLSALTKPQDFIPVNYIFGVGYNAVKPEYAADWFARFQINFILPK
jgi:hypothetical protein